MPIERLGLVYSSSATADDPVPRTSTRHNL
jgi:hypothetical protein